jgi:hypothetical protein
VGWGWGRKPPYYLKFDFVSIEYNLKFEDLIFIVNLMNSAWRSRATAAPILVRVTVIRVEAFS